MKTILIVLFACLLLFSVAGCDNKNSSKTNPLSTQTTVVGDRVVWEERACYPNNEVRLVRVLYTANGTYILDYPVGFIGPIPDGHMREDGTQAPSSVNLRVLDPDIGNARPAGDPTADDAKGDGDGTVVSK